MVYKHAGCRARRNFGGEAAVVSEVRWRNRALYQEQVAAKQHSIASRWQVQSLL
jgi:hypothetical protein